MSMADTIAVMNEGRIEQLATPREIYDAPETPFVADFIGDTNFIKQDGATLAVRPERIEISRNGGTGLRGEVVTAMVIGPAVQCLIRTDDGQEVLVRQQRTGKEQVDAPREGERVVLTWADDAALPLSTDLTGGPR